MKNLAKFVRECSSELMFDSLDHIESILEEAKILRYANVNNKEYVVFNIVEHLLSCKTKDFNFTVILHDCDTDSEAVKIFKDIVNNCDRELEEFDEWMLENYSGASLSFN